MLHYYRLGKDGVPIEESDILEWAAWVQTAVILLQQTNLGDVAIITKFIGFSGKEPPELWETEIHGSLWNGQRFTCAGTRDDAEKHHLEVVETIKNLLAKNQNPTKGLL